MNGKQEIGEGIREEELCRGVGDGVEGHFSNANDARWVSMDTGYRLLCVLRGDGGGNALKQKARAFGGSQTLTRYGILVRKESGVARRIQHKLQVHSIAAVEVIGGRICQLHHVCWVDVKYAVNIVGAVDEAAALVADHGAGRPDQPSALPLRVPTTANNVARVGGNRRE